MNPIVTFVAGTGLLLLWIFYMGTTVHRSKRIVGSVLSVLMAAFFLWAYQSEGIKKGIDLQGGSEFVVQLEPGQDENGKPKAVGSDDVQQAMAVFEKRLSPQGEKDLVLQPSGTDRIIIQMPGVAEKEKEDVRTKIQQVAKLEFRMAAPPSANDIERSIKYEELPMRDKEDSERSLWVSRKTDLGGEYVKNAYAFYDAKGWQVHLDLNGEGAKKFDEIAATNQGNRMAIIVDGEIISAPVLQSSHFGGTAIISGNFKENDVRTLSSVLENPLKNKPVILSQSEVSATFGADTVKQGIMSGIAALIVTALFMTIYYRLAGTVSLLGLVITALITFGSMAVFQFTMTMPGIAGIVLTIGMAVDANVLIYERLREEMAAGKSLAAAVEASHDRAFSAIFDSNITTLITSVILFFLGSGLIKGFAITLSIGVIATLFGALIVTRVALNWLVDGGIIKSIKVFRILPDRTFNVMGVATKGMLMSAVVIGVLAFMFFKKGQTAYGIDFRGGSKVSVGLADGKQITEDEVFAALKGVTITKQDGATADIGSIRYQKSNSPTGDVVTIRGEEASGPAIKSTIEAKFKDRIKVEKDGVISSNLDTVGSVIGDEMKEKSAWAVLGGLFGIFVYLIFRFETSFAVGAIVALVHDCIFTAIGAVALGQELSLLHISAILTIAGYSVNDTIVIFDRLREVITGGHKGTLRELMNEAISLTLSRTILTSAATLCSVIVLIWIGGPAMQDFALPIFIGMIAGVYSTIFIASPIVLWWAKRTGTSLQRQILDSVQTPQPAQA